ncbi:alanine--tRNA ligase [Tsukamurella sp. 8F]|uniref:alanine--tRNA ligase n=1 Tax=unclassified Tsukamurella TaxID=2633480 RepID=UPI0023B9A983|nr:MULTISPECIES: alanine--tRNA ligase [unclassified Tsukamurella]MDF0529174.1 alanine--tRNA ligase [Tsukamurella sp. 8J]MDF0585359.1 alanine--tRNA ligase [Tsukamurella sp. 8F]
MQTHEIRKRFTDHFVKNGHTEVPSASLVLNDPNQLFVIAGMVPFVPYFLGQQTPPYDRATSIQKCVRTLDIEEVGITTRHNTFFQMAGNFSFGDYFKRDAIRFAWTLLTGAVEDGGFGIDPERLWSTVYLDDDEARDLWLEVGQVPERIQRRGLKDNYWSMGIPGPAGPCSEIFYDRGPDFGVEGGPEADEDRYIEIWNLVFMQNERGKGLGKENFEILGELPKKNIDTGMGIERVAFLLQGVDNVYETDLLRPVIDRAEELTGQRYSAGDPERDRLFRVIADHTRTAVMLIEDGVNPGNDGRGYVLRRLLRRVVRSARLLGAAGETMGAFVDTVLATMSPSYPSLADDAERIRTVAIGEEAAFLRTLEQGTTLFGNAASSTRAAGSSVLSGDDAFTLHDTYGFPIDLTLEMASEAGLTVDEDGFRALMAEQRQRAKDDANSRKSALADLSVFREFVDRGPTEFTGFDELTSGAQVLGLVRDGVRVPTVATGEDVEVVLDRSPLYAEAGGQLADIGTITTAAGAQIVVTDVQRVAKTVWRHQGTVASGEVAEGDTVTVAVDPAHRHGSTQGHSGTHLVHAALRQVLGPNAVQAGSLNRPGYLRFDFRWQGALSEQQRAEIEGVTNAAVQADYAVNTDVTDLETAKRRGAMALFGENYGERVRVVEIGGPFSLELCGGTHVASSGLVGPVTLLGESSVGSGVRRVEAYVGLDAVTELNKERALVSALSSSLKVPSEELPGRVESMVNRLKDAEKELEKLRSQAALSALSELAASPERVGAARVVAARAPEGVAGGDLRGLVTQLKGRVGAEPAVVALFAEDGDKVPFAVAVNDAAQDLGVRAGDLVKAAAPAVGGRGGGKPDLAQGAGSDASGIDSALAAVRTAVASAVGA